MLLDRAGRGAAASNGGLRPMYAETGGRSRDRGNSSNCTARRLWDEDEDERSQRHGRLDSGKLGGNRLGRNVVVVRRSTHHKHRVPSTSTWFDNGHDPRLAREHAKRERKNTGAWGVCVWCEMWWQIHKSRPGRETMDGHNKIHDGRGRERND